MSELPERPVIEPADRDDLDRVVALWAALIEEGQADGLHIVAGDSRPAIRRRLSTAIVEDRVLVARRTDEIIGLTVVTRDTGVFVTDRERGLVSVLYVVPEHRQQGLGTKLLTAGERRLAELGVETVMVETLAAADEVRSFYQHHGYRPHRVTLTKPLENKSNRKDGT